MALNRVDEVRAADWLSQIHVKKLSCVYKVSDTVLSVVEIPLKHPIHIRNVFVFWVQLSYVALNNSGLL